MKELTKTLRRLSDRTLNTVPNSLLQRSSLLAMSLVAALVAIPASANPVKITELIGHPVETDNGDKLGNIEDFSIDPKTGSLEFVVISIGSFLVENSLIAVEPNALSQVANGDPVILRMEDLEVAHRFNADNWPDSADVRSVAKSDSEGSESEDGSNSDTSTALSATGTATITAGSKKATYENGKRELINGPMRRASQTTSAKPAASRRTDRVVPNFKNLDRNKDGRLSRSEIGAELDQRSGFKDLDADSNGTIDDFEYDAYQQREATRIHRRWVGNR